MSFDGHVLWKRMLIGPWALTTVGAVTAAAVATAAPPRNLRRLVTWDVRDFTFDMGEASLFCACPGFSPYRIQPPGLAVIPGGGGQFGPCYGVFDKSFDTILDQFQD